MADDAAARSALQASLAQKTSAEILVLKAMMTFIIGEIASGKKNPQEAFEFLQKLRSRSDILVSSLRQTLGEEHAPMYVEMERAFNDILDVIIISEKRQ